MFHHSTNSRNCYKIWFFRVEYIDEKVFFFIYDCIFFFYTVYISHGRYLFSHIQYSSIYVSICLISPCSIPFFSRITWQVLRPSCSNVGWSVGLLAGCSAGRSGGNHIFFLKGWKLHFHAPIGALAISRVKKSELHYALIAPRSYSYVIQYIFANSKERIKVRIN